MSTFPPFAKCCRSGADAPSAASPEGANAQSAGAGAAAPAANSTEHRFDKFARRIGASMLDAIRVTLSVFSSPDKERWSAVRLLHFLKGAEDLTRGMLREIAEKIFISPAPERMVSVRAAVAPSEPGARLPYFRLGVKREIEEVRNEITSPRHPPTCSADLPPHTAQQDEGDPGLAQRANRDDDTSNEPASVFERRLIALEDVLAHPGKHAARMARALYRAAHDDSARLIAKSPNDVLLDKINLALAAHHRGDGNKVARLHDEVMKLEPG